MEIYEVKINNIAHLVQLDEETAVRIGANPVALAKSAAPQNKSRVGRNKSNGDSSDSAPN